MAREKINLARFKVRDLYSAIVALDGRAEVAKDGDGKTLGIISKPYEIDGKAIYALGLTRAYLKDSVISDQAAQQGIAAKFAGKLQNSPDKKTDAQQQAESEMQKELHELAIEEVDIEVHKLNIVSLKIETNKLPARIVGDLLPMLDGEL